MKAVANEELEVEDYQYQSGAVYKGTWLGFERGSTNNNLDRQDKPGLRHGEGHMCWPDGAQYMGTWHCNQASRYGKFIYPNEDIYEGSWSNNNMCGYGVYRHKNGTVYRG